MTSRIHPLAICIFHPQGRIPAEAFYRREIIHGHEVDADLNIKAVWKQLDEFGAGSPPLYPDGLLELLKQTKGRSRPDNSA